MPTVSLGTCWPVTSAMLIDQSPLVTVTVSALRAADEPGMRATSRAPAASRSKSFLCWRRPMAWYIARLGSWVSDKGNDRRRLRYTRYSRAPKYPTSRPDHLFAPRHALG